MAGHCEALQRALIAAAERLQMSDAEADRLERAMRAPRRLKVAWTGQHKGPPSHAAPLRRIVAND